MNNKLKSIKEFLEVEDPTLLNILNRINNYPVKTFYYGNRIDQYSFSISYNGSNIFWDLSKILLSEQKLEVIDFFEYAFLT